jgi:hypothetical protein
MAGSPHDHQRHLVETAHGSALAGSARAVWTVADLCGSTLSVATRDEKRALNYHAMLVLASIVRWLEG